METSFRHYMSALAAAMRQELPDVSDTRAEFTVDDVPYVFTAEEDSTSVFVYAVIGALPQDEDAKARVFAGLLVGGAHGAREAPSAKSIQRSQSDERIVCSPLWML